ncbi:D-alanyl-D-alanine carboxypeptidase family protein [Clostridium felsineum]|uniref:D-alanyl-D-alanine carboxypeptidase family protein n=1 Tax=Clostridium felsineum TaxID=36839 RepID=UPI00098C7D43|nr:D-alanyl-D-alanine carboxypeptidase family protein [Clostridium felsineum]URZ00606.1 D-alanyl-D-alanine carboxypeptidase DacF [Clostridium felsineum]URZ16348.1 D-alanyl-D-alanine carboxypeptidase DacF [Clostridium felsineum DSM 794]
MKKRGITVGVIVLLLLFLQSLFLPFSVKAFEPKNDAEGKVPSDTSGINVDAKSAILLEPSTGAVIYEKNSHEKFAPASVTKIMTMLLTMEAVDSGKIKLSDKVTISEEAKKMGGSSMLLDTGEVRTVEELLKGIAIASGNDAAVAMSEYLGGSQANFVNMMNKRAQELGMKDTSFKNCTGLNADGHMTTAYDISIMSRELLKHPKILKYTGTYMETISEGRKSPIGLVNHNKLVRFFKGCDGLKTGFTDEAKYCISATAVKDNVRMLAIIMGAPTYKVRNKDASMLMNYGFSKFSAKKVVEKDSIVKKVPLNKKGDKFFLIKAADDLSIVVPRGDKCNITNRCLYKIDKKDKELKKGSYIGYAEYYVNGKYAGKVKVYCDRDVKLGGFFQNFKNDLKSIFDNSI